MAEYKDGLGGLSDVARALNEDEEWAWKQAKTRADLQLATDEIVEQAARLRESVEEMQGGTVHQLRREPTATIELDEDELQAVIDRLEDPVTREELTAHGKFTQALAIELGPGGKFAA